MNNDDVVLEREEVECQSKLDQVVFISREMLRFVRQEAWQQLIALESERSHLLSEFFQKPVEECDLDDVTSAIKLIQALDKETMQHIKVEYKVVSNELKKLNKGRRVSSAYLE